MSIPKVSVLIITYNHEKFIAQAIESILMQKTNFNYEIVIGEDCSKDKTKEILLKYKKRHPKKIRLFLNKQNLGVSRNLKKILVKCRGRYVALLEGDDYWTNPYKLQKQVNFLEENPDYAMCFHNVKVIYEDKSKKPYTYCNKKQKEICQIEDLFYTNPIPTCSVIFRNNLILPNWYYGLTNCDWVVNILNAQHGKIKYFKDIMGVYRIHKGGSWNKRNSTEKHESIIKTYKALEKHFQQNKNYLYHILRGKAGTYYEIAKEFNKKGNKYNTIKNLFFSLYNNPDKFNLKKYPRFLKQMLNQLLLGKS